MSEIVHDPRGSIWRRWDLHIHTKGTKKNDQFKSDTFDEFCLDLFHKALENEIGSFAVTDYFNIDNYKKVKEYINNIDSNPLFTTEEQEKIKQIFILPNVELRMLPVTDKGRLVNIHCIFNPDYEDSLENNFFSSIEYSAEPGKKFRMNKQGLIDLGKFLDSSLNGENAYKRGINSFVVNHSDLQKLWDENKSFRENVIIAVSNSNRDGASAFQKHYDFFEGEKPSNLEGVRKSIYCISQVIFSSNEEDSNYFIGKRKDDVETVKTKCGSLKPCIHGSDAHTEDKLFSPDENKFCWIKSDLTFEGLKQILYEPEPGERVKIGPIKPDQKDDYKVLSKIQFEESNDFPSEIVFNKNLCSIIGSRSSGKSALLAYIAHSVDPVLAEEMLSGPGEGEEYHWDKIDLDYSIEWNNGKSNEESLGKIVYIRQNYLFEKSKDSDEIKARIKPVLFRVRPEFEVKYNQAEQNIGEYNHQVLNMVDQWFGLSDSIKSLREQIKNLGNKNAIEKESELIEAKIKEIKDKNQLSEEEINQYKKIMSDLSILDSRITEINTELLQLSEVLDAGNYFSALSITLTPALANLPNALQTQIQESLDKKESEILNEVNKLVLVYKKSIEKEKLDADKKVITIKNKNKELIEKYQKNIELEGLIKKITENSDIIQRIETFEKEITSIEEKKKTCDKDIKEKINQRKSFIEDLKSHLTGAYQNSIAGINFGIEYELGENINKIIQKINIKEKSNFVERGVIKINQIRETPDLFLSDLYSGQQKIIAGYDKIDVAKDTLSLTEKILFTAEMEGDKIGGFSEPTMTPGKRALFLLRLILAESEDTWPLLIDQPEDDLDSRSIYYDIVPFLKKKKKERQIIMVSHDANLVVGADSEQIIVANRHGRDRENEDQKQFNYLTGSLEFSQIKDKDCIDTLKSKGVREHACEILDGGEIAFEQRKNKYNIK